MEYTVNDRVRFIRTNHGMTQDDFCKLLNLKRSTYANKEKSGKFSFEDLTIIADYFNITVDQLLKTESVKLFNESDEDTSIKSPVLRLNEPSAFDKIYDKSKETELLTHMETEMVLNCRKLPWEERIKIYEYIEEALLKRDIEENNK